MNFNRLICFWKWQFFFLYLFIVKYSILRNGLLREKHKILNAIMTFHDLMSLSLSWVRNHFLISLPLSNPDVYIWCSVVSTSEPWFRTRIDAGSHGKDIGVWGALEGELGSFYRHWTMERKLLTTNGWDW